ncbi:hypothetical protein ACO3UB_02625 [Methanocaldococcus sp. 16A]
MIKLKKRGQISIDFILAILFLMLISLFIFHNISAFNEGSTEALIADRMYSIADTFENYAILSYTKNERIILYLKPIGVKSYTIYFGNKKIVVNTTRIITFIPDRNGVIVKGVEGDVENSGLNLTNAIKVTYDNNKYILKNISMQIR